MPDLTQFSTTLHIDDDLEFRFARDRQDYPHDGAARWLVAPDTDIRFAFDWPALYSCQRVDNVTEAVYRVRISAAREGLLLLRQALGVCFARAFVRDPKQIDAVLDIAREAVPKHAPAEGEVIPVTFWAAGAHGPTSYRRELDADPWLAIRENYTPSARALLERLVDPEFVPGKGGQMILWHGDPGTGKTTALRCLAREWRRWCDMHYIVDPDAFFGTDAAYMMQVLMGGEDSVGVGPEPTSPRWRVLILEDCGELLQPDARRQVGQALSRLLNACDGMIGRGLRVMLLVTTNEPADRLNEAVSRPGRCAARVEFQRFAPMEADDWLRAHGYAPDSALGGGSLPYEGSGQVTLADLYGMVEDFAIHAPERVVGFR